MELRSIKKVHFIGIGGIGISYVAHFFLRQNAVVSGSDLARSIVTDQLAERGASVFEGHDAKNVKEDIELVIYNDAIPEDNPELVRAKELGIPMMTNFQVVGELSKDYTTIVVAGNKGKTTTTAMLSYILEIAGCDPTAMVGSIVNDWKCNFRGGDSQYLVVEGDEFKEHFLEFDPNIVIITNMAADHMDYYGTIDNLIAAFQKLIDKIPNDGLLVINQDDVMTKKLDLPDCQIITFGMKTTADVLAQNRTAVRNKQEFEVIYRGQSMGDCSILFPGMFNVYNALGAVAVSLFLGISERQIKEALSTFKGTWRRFQILGLYNMATVISDYAHHPTAVHGTIEATRDFYEDRRIVAVFQPHTRHRTLSLFKDFVKSLDNADVVIIPDIFFVEGREVISEEEMNSEMLVKAIQKRDKENYRDRQVIASGDLKRTKEKIDEIVQKDDVVLMMGAGDIYQLAEELV